MQVFSLVHNVLRFEVLMEFMAALPRMHAWACSYPGALKYKMIEKFVPEKEHKSYATLKSIRISKSPMA